MAFLPAKPTKLGRFFWESFSSLSMKFYFHSLVIESDFEVEVDKAVLLLGNHISWWDGFWPLIVNHDFLKKSYYVMMLESELTQRTFMRQGGAFSINPGSKSVIKSIQYCEKLLNDPQNMVLIYPQGRLHSLYEREFHFEKGIDRLLKNTSKNVQVIGFSALLDYLDKPRPTLYFRMKKFALNDLKNAASLENSYSEFYQKCLNAQAKIAEIHHG